MSEQETITGYIKPIPRVGSGCDDEPDDIYFERATGGTWVTKGYTAENIQDAIGWNCLSDHFVCIGDTIYELHAKELDDSGCYCNMQESDDGTISFTTSYYNGGTCLTEMLQDYYDSREKCNSVETTSVENKPVFTKDQLIQFYEETMDHQNKVRRNINTFISRLSSRGITHDKSKFSEEERDLFVQMTPKLKNSTYGSDEYKQFLKDLKPALDHHYACNTHHPEAHLDGMKGMTLVDLVEMFCDWKAAAERHNDGDILKSININQQRFGYSDDIKQILINTVMKEM